jgi:hypothetical protein
MDGTDPCTASNAAIADEILRLKPRRVILFGAWLLHSTNWQSDTKFNKQLRRTLHKLRSGLEDIILLGPSPSWPPSLPAIASKFWLDFGALPDRLKLSPKDYKATDSVFAEIAVAEHVQYISIFDALCNAEGCLSHTPASRSELLVWDSGHLTVEGATYIVDKLGLARLDRVRVQ